MGEEIAKGLGFKALVDLQGRRRWLSFSSNAFQDRHWEIFTTKGLEEAVTHCDKTGNRGPLLFWHSPNVKLGECDFQAVVGRFLVESGPFDNTEVGRRAAEFFIENSDGWGTSIGFMYRMRDRATGVYPWLQISERSVLPVEDAANPWCEFSVKGEQMAQISEEKKRAIEEVLGPEVAAKLIAKAEEQTGVLELAGVQYKQLGQTSAAELLRYLLTTEGLKEFKEALLAEVRRQHPSEPYIEQLRQLHRQQAPLLDLIPGAKK